MESLRRLDLVDAIREHIAGGAPFLGICVGMQVLCDLSEEFGDHACLEVVRGSVRRFPPSLKVPQIGWNQVSFAPESRDHPLFEGIADGSDFYFVHSYFCDLREPDLVAGATEYGVRFPSILLRGRLAGVQFHPEKSGTVGLRLLANFVAWAGAEVASSQY
jgi:imidazole glycerol-phosphate synthase subunit HisH